MYECGEIAMLLSGKVEENGKRNTDNTGSGTYHPHEGIGKESNHTAWGWRVVHVRMSDTQYEWFMPSCDCTV
jgi:hypothetical protein